MVTALGMVAVGIPVTGQETPSAVDAPWPTQSQVAWGAESVQVESAYRARIRLNGAWKFSPVRGGGQANIAPEKGWGFMAVPGNWRRPQEMLAKGTGPQWTGFDGRKLAGAWYERRFRVPADWAGRRIALDFQRVSTDATVWIGDKLAGKIHWPEGELDITHLVTTGQEATIRAFVVATTNQSEVTVLMGDEPGQNYTAKAELHSAGIVGNVTLRSRPPGAHVSDVYIQPSFRKSQLGVDVELSGVTRSGPVQLIASLLDENGKEEARFTHSTIVQATPIQRVNAWWLWSNPRLWDVNQPNLYTLRLRVRGAGLEDETATRFGFREAWVQGRDVFLNGTPFRMRPFLLTPHATNASRVLNEARELGYNFGELWPEDIEARSRDARYSDWFEIADREGLPLSGIMPHMGWMGGNVNSPSKLASYRATAERLMRRYRNHPSIILWGTSGNMMGGSRDPRYVGRREAATASELLRGSQSARVIPAAEQGVSVIKALDSARPVLIHNGGPAGDFYTLNNYLNFIPLQEREEWLSHYAQHGDMPLMYVEFGTPVSLSLMRARNGFQSAPVSEMFLSEYTASYLGDSAYQLEPAAYRKRSAELFEKNQTYSWHLGLKERDYAPAWLQMQNLFIRNTWRSWRTMGITGGMIAWDTGYARSDGKLTPAGEALRDNNGPTLAWIAGAARPGDVAELTAKDHSYFAGETVSKQIALLNDTRAPQKYSLQWTASVSDKTVGNGQESGELGVGQTLFVSLEFAAPTVSGKTDGAILLEASIGNTSHADRFEFRVWPRPQPERGAVMVFDPEGKTTAMLRSLGYTVIPWDGRAKPQLLVLGRNSLTRADQLPGDWKAFVQNGGRVLLSGHDPHWLRGNLGVRVSFYQSRRVWKIGDNAALQGLDELDLRDWRGQSTLLDPHPDYNTASGPDVQLAKTTYPYAGWRWGTRGTVASAAIEKPHRSGWTPLLESEFDLAYAPLMELNFGTGKILWSQLDLEDHAIIDPAARQLARSVIAHAATTPLSPRVAVTYIGGDAGKTLLQSLGVRFQSATALPKGGLVVVGPDALVEEAPLEDFARDGGKVLFLPRQKTEGASGLQLRQESDFVGSLRVPQWLEARGLSASDLRWRNASSAWIASGGNDWQTGADGLLARRSVGDGVMVWAQIDPTILPADDKTYFRLTRWRQTRALSQVLANLGAAFEMDERVFSPRAGEQPFTLALDGEWRAKLIQRKEAAPSPDKGHADPGISDAARDAASYIYDDSSWQVVKVPGDMDAYGADWGAADGEAMFRKVVDVPKTVVGQALKLTLATVDDHDETFFNGVRVGGVGAENRAAYSVKREYIIPANLVKAGRNVIAVRVWDKFGGGGFTSSNGHEMRLQLPQAQAKESGFYHPDYREDWELGDEPYRYYNW